MTPASSYRTPTLRGLMIPVGLILLVSMAVIGGVAVYAAQGQDRVATQASLHLGKSVIADRQRALSVIMIEYSFWDEAVNHLLENFDPEWLEGNFGGYMYENLDMAMSFVTDAEDRPIYGMVDGELSPDNPFDRLSGGLVGLAKRARRSRTRYPSRSPVF